MAGIENAKEPSASCQTGCCAPATGLVSTSDEQPKLETSDADACDCCVTKDKPSAVPADSNTGAAATSVIETKAAKVGGDACCDGDGNPGCCSPELEAAADPVLELTTTGANGCDCCGDKRECASLAASDDCADTCCKDAEAPTRCTDDGAPAAPDADGCSCCGDDTQESEAVQDVPVDDCCCPPPGPTQAAREGSRCTPCCSPASDVEPKSQGCVDRCGPGSCFMEDNEKEAARILKAGPKTGDRSSCCSVRSAASTRTKRRPALSLHALCCICCPPLARCFKSCCFMGGKGAADRQGATRRAAGPSSSKTGRCSPAKSGLSRTPSPRVSEDSCKDDCCRESGAETAKKAVEKSSCCQDPACGKAGGFDPSDIKACGKSEVLTVPLADTPVAIDLEKGSGAKERVVVSVQGMTCTGCETKLFRSLAGISGVSNTQTSLVLSRAEFDVDVGQTSVEDAIANLKRMTGFECTRMTNKGGHDLDILVEHGDDRDVLSRQPLPTGILDISVLDQGTLRVTYDPEIIGARDLVSRAFGRPLKLAPPRADPSLSAGSRHVRNVGIMTAISIILTIPVLVLEWAPLPDNDILYGSISLALATIIQVVVAGPFYIAAFKSLIFTRVIEMDMLIVLSTSAAYIFSVIAFAFVVKGRPLSTGEFFETSTLVVTLIMVGRFVSALARQKAVESISVRSLQQPTALLIEGDGPSMKEIDARLLQYGDVFRVMPESRIATDGTVISGISEVDESVITGESSPIEKSVKSPVVAGSVNGSGTLDVRVTRLPGNNTISTIANMVDAAKLSKPRTQEIADRVAGYFVPAVVSLTIITFSIWIAIGLAVRNQNGSEAAVQATTYAIAVLIISCPCAIGLAVPMVIVIAGGVAADRGVIFRTAETLETARKVTHVVFDKTGTLTTGKLTVSDAVYFGDEQAERISSLALGLVADIKHPVSQAVAKHLKDSGVLAEKLTNVKASPGKGVHGQCGSTILRAGNPHWLGMDSDPSIANYLSSASTLLCITVGGMLGAVFILQDSVRLEAADVMQRLKRAGISISIVSGDNTSAVDSVALILGISPSHALARQDPAAKAAYITTLRKQGATVMFVGDGTNDAVALAAAHIGLHIGDDAHGGGLSSSTSDVARGAADAVLLRPDLRGVCVLIELSRAAFRRVTFNFAWSFVYNLFAVLLAAGAFVHARVPPAYAGLGELVSVLPVIAAAVQLRWARVGGGITGE